MKNTLSENNVIDSFLNVLKKEEDGDWVDVLFRNPNLHVEATDYLSQQKGM